MNQILKAKVYPDAGKESVILKKDRYQVFTREPAQDNRANKDTLRLLAQYLTIPENKIRIISGHHSQNKTFEILY